MTDATGKGLAPVWRDPCAGTNRDRRRAAAHGDTPPMLRWTHGTIRGSLCPAHGSTRLVGAQWIVERRAAACRLRADLAPQSIPRRRGRVDRVRVSSRGPQPPARFTGGVLKPDKLSLQGISESPDGVTVSLADQPGVEVLAVQVDVAKQPAIAVPGVSPVGSASSVTVLASSAALV